MSIYVVDACVAAKWFFEEEHSESARRLLAGDYERHAPDCLFLEIDNLLCKRIRRGELAEADGQYVRKDLKRHPITYWPSKDLRDAAFDLAATTRCSLYDSLYVALAVQLGASLVTADRRLHNTQAAGIFAQYTVWVGDLA